VGSFIRSQKESPSARRAALAQEMELVWGWVEQVGVRVRVLAESDDVPDSRLWVHFRPLGENGAPACAADCPCVGDSRGYGSTRAHSTSKGTHKDMESPRSN